MRKTRKGQLKASGEIARAKYQEFLTKADWMSAYIRKDDLIKFLKQFVEDQESTYRIESARYRDVNYQGTGIVTIQELKERADRAYLNYYRLQGIYDAKGLIRFLEHKGFSMSEPESATHNFIAYCRDN